MSNDYILQASGITKQFPGVLALDNVQLNVKKGEVHALIGENGAGKSTLMKTILGIYKADSGTIIFDGEERKNYTARDALLFGISMIHQELALALNVTVAENVWVGRLPTTKLGTIDYKTLFKKTKALLDELHIDIDPTTTTSELSVAQMQMVEIAKAVSYDAKLIIMDEPTSALSDKEIKSLFNIINSFKKKGVSIILITHKLKEIFEIADKVTVFRDGTWVGEYPIKEITQDKLISLMVGREVSNLFPKEAKTIGKTILEVKKLSQKGLFKDISFSLREGEVLGVSGLMGAGRSEIMTALYGAAKADSGEIWLDGKKVSITSPKDAIRNGFAMVTENRAGTGLSLIRPVSENMVIAYLKKLSKFGVCLSKKHSEAVQDGINKFSIKVSDPAQAVKNLSGGNQQKVILARWLLTKPRILILDEPTRGIDVGAKAEIYKLISQLAASGISIILVSSELPEILGMSDRVIVIGNGELKGTFDISEATQEKIMACAVSAS